MENKIPPPPEDAFDAIRFYLFEHINVGDAVIAAVSRTAALACRHRVSIRVRLETELVMEAHRSAFMVLLQAMIESAIRMSSRHGDISIAISGHGLAVRSDGPGWAPQELGRIGEWIQVDEGSSDSFKTSLLLSVCRSIAVNHGWSLRAINTYPGVLLFLAWQTQ